MTGTIVCEGAAACREVADQQVALVADVAVPATLVLVLALLVTERYLR